MSLTRRTLFTRLSAAVVAVVAEPVLRWLPKSPGPVVVPIDELSAFAASTPFELSDLELARQAMLDAAGAPMRMAPNVIVVPPRYEADFRRLLNLPVDNDAYQVVASERVPDGDWFMARTQQSDDLDEPWEYVR